VKCALCDCDVGHTDNCPGPRAGTNVIDCLADVVGMDARILCAGIDAARQRAQSGDQDGAEKQLSALLMKAADTRAARKEKD